MRTMNTTAGPVAVDRDPPRHVNTSRVVEEDMVYEDEPAEIVHVLCARGYAATFEDGHREDLVFWVVGAEGEVFGATLSDDGRVDLVENNAEDIPGFTGYIQTTNEPKENN